MSEMLDYQSRLNSITAARGSYHMQFSHYDPVPQHLSGKIIEQAQIDGRIRTHDADE
jgi:elongation factor G